ncbi:hypothetical protein FR483_n280L [Paramecium bursaria Chlorella virus FR483]|uniref:Uncharacterized protein n280L n=1 Tax=Paramecium bursaria Chlorella virus FR483 TaxID=399781 RepID=A7J6Y4_PBCVF|nr:hypothetical protein FR483_n280L [Paramecium bursaria Chlorella virus FR483]ABT15565.1 hypothetical protein FR483_n280L [Paramecium bursaria Chlorella virus FR483]
MTRISQRCSSSLESSRQILYMPQRSSCTAWLRRMSLTFPSWSSRTSGEISRQMWRKMHMRTSCSRGLSLLRHTRHMVTLKVGWKC